jgi:hypothetical protein
MISPIGHRPENVTYKAINGKNAAMINIQIARTFPNVFIAPSRFVEERRTK